MGNEGSIPKGVEVEEKAIDVTENWIHCSAVVRDSTSAFGLSGHATLSVFKCESSKGKSRHLDRYITNLMTHRHPCILRYMAHWEGGGTTFLATEPAQPLSKVIHNHHPLQICIGLHQILQALDFLHSNTSQSHNNIGIGSIYVLSDGSWKLGGLEFLKPFAELNHAYLKQIKNLRYSNAIDDKEETSDDLKKIDQYGFYTLIEDVFKGKNDNDVPNLTSFKQYCKKELQHPTSSSRISFSSLLKHEFFNQDFISIHKFLTSLPVKSEQEKRIFFGGLLVKLHSFDERTIAAQLGVLLLSRLVLLNSTAREKVLPHLLTPKDNSNTKEGFFSINVFKQYISPLLIRMFKVRDTQVRMLLLKHFSEYMPVFTNADLAAHILPELLLGIKDTDDLLVSMTLYCLADLIPVLGASTVIGPKRTKLFSDGRPMLNCKLDSSVTSFMHKSRRPAQRNRNDQVSSSIMEPEAVPGYISHNESVPASAILAAEGVSFGSKESIEIETNPYLQERPSPDGGEDLDSEIIQNQIADSANASEGEWSDWEQDDRDAHNSETDHFVNNDEELAPETATAAVKFAKDPSFLQKAAIDAKTKKLTDISELDIKNQKYTNTRKSESGRKDEFDFFTDMEPVIEKASTLTVNDALFVKEDGISKNLSFAPVEVEGASSAWVDANWDDD